MISRLDEFLEAAAAEAALVPALRGELRWSYGYTWTLQGVHGARAALKRRHSEAELWLERVAEPLAALAAGLGLRVSRRRSPRGLADSAAVAVSRLDRRLHLR